MKTIDSRIVDLEKRAPKPAAVHVVHQYGVYSIKGEAITQEEYEDLVIREDIEVITFDVIYQNQQPVVGKI